MIRQAAAAFMLLLCGSVAIAQTPVEPPPAVAPASSLVLAPPAILDLAKSVHGTACEFEAEFGPDIRYAAYELIYKADGDAPDQATRKGVLHELYCTSGAYNLTNVYFVTLSDNGMADANTAKPVQFATPAYSVVYEDDDSEKAVLRIDIQGYTAIESLMNPDFDSAKGTMTSFDKLRGIGDASTIGTWQFLEGRFVLTHYEVDASFDGEINPTIIYDAVPETP